ncbi:MAG: AEC family transporter [Geminicoccaceae bacterium]|nr:AEC family transporter [Geminicoccaceae bacterium]
MFDAVLPLILLILLGAALARGGFLDENRRRAMDALLFFVLMPAFIIARLGRSELDERALFDLCLLVTALIAAAGLLMLALRRPICAALGDLSGPTFTSLLQGVIRNNFFIPFAIAESAGLDIGALLAMATVLNILPATAISVFALVRHGDGRQSFGWRGALAALARNPLVLAAIAGSALSVSGLGLAAPFEGALRMLGDGVLGLALLAVGAGLRLSAMPRARAGILLASFAKLVLLPLAAWAIGRMIGADVSTALAALMLHCAPTAAGAFILARQLGGDSETMAVIISFQTLACLVTMPTILQILAAQ